MNVVVGVMLLLPLYNQNFPYDVCENARKFI